MKNKEGLLQRGGNSFQAAWGLGWWGPQGEGPRVTFPIPRFGNVGPPHPSGQEVPPPPPPLSNPLCPTGSGAHNTEQTLL